MLSPLKISILISLISIILLNSCLREIPTELKGYDMDYALKSRWQDDTLKQGIYTNNGFGFSFQIPKGWNVPEVDTLDSLATTDPNELLRIEKVADSSNGRVLSIILMAEQIFKYKEEQVWSAQKFLFYARDYMKNESNEDVYKYTDLSYAGPDTISGRKFCSHHYKVMIDSVDNYYMQKTYSSLYDSILFNVYLSYVYEDELKEMTKTIQNIKWKSAPVK